jgi:hypothetical protein
MLVHKVEIPFKMYQNEPISEIADYVADGEDFLMEDSIVDLLSSESKCIFVELFIFVILGHVGGKLLTLEAGLHSDRI